MISNETSSSQVVESTLLSESEISSLTDTQERILSSLSILSSCLSILGSCVIVYMVIKNSHNTPYKRILFGLSVSDIIASTTWALAPFLQPADSSQRIWARGTNATCNFLGFMTQLSFTAIWYNGMLSYYYLLTVRFRVRGKVLAKWYEPWMHICSIGFNVVAGIVGLSKGYYSEMELSEGCYIAEYPAGCELNGGCIGDIIGWIVSGGPVLFLFISVLVNNAIIYFYVRRTTHRTIDKSMQGRGHQEQRIQAVATQALLYVATFLVAYIWTFAIRVLESLGVQAADAARIYPLLVLASIFLPLQGAFNLFVYSRPNYTRIRKTFPNESILFALRKAWFGSSSGRAPITSIDGTLFSSRRGQSVGLHTTLVGSVPDVDKVRLQVSQAFSETFSGNDHLRRDIRIRDPFDLASITDADQTGTRIGNYTPGEDHDSRNQQEVENRQLAQEEKSPTSSLDHHQDTDFVGLNVENEPSSLVMQDDGTCEELPRHLEQNNGEPFTRSSDYLDSRVPSPPTDRYIGPVPSQVDMAIEDPDELMLIEDLVEMMDTSQMMSFTTDIILDDSNR